MEIVKKNEFVEIKFTGTANGEVFDSNIEEDLKKVNSQSPAEKTIVCIGQEMVIPGLDKALDGKEVGKEYKISIKAPEAFGVRKRELVRVLPLRVFSDRKVNPRPGMTFTFDNALARVIAVSGGRVTTDFNNPLSGKDVDYRFTITRKVTDDREKTESFFRFFMRFVPEFEVKDKIVVKGPEVLKGFVESMNAKAKEVVGKEIVFEIKEEKKEETPKGNAKVSENLTNN